MLNEVFAQRRCTVERITGRVSDGAGGWVEARTVVGELVGALQPSTASDVERQIGPIEQARVRWEFYVPPASDVERNDHLVFAGHRFRVTHVTRWASTDAVAETAAGALLGSLDHDVVGLIEVQSGQ